MKKKTNKNNEKNKRNTTKNEEDNLYENEIIDESSNNSKEENDNTNSDWLNILQNELENFSLGSSNENSEEDLIKEKSFVEIKNNKEKLQVNNEKLDENNLIEEDSLKKSIKEVKEIYKAEEIEENLLKKVDDSIFFEGKEFKKYSRFNYYNDKRKIKKIIYKCINNRKDDRIKRATGNQPFCNGNIEYIEPGQNVKSGYFIKTNHSEDCIEMDYKKSILEIKKKVEKEEDKEKFINLCNDLMDNSNIYDRRLFKEEFKKIYNNNKFIFSNK